MADLLKKKLSVMGYDVYEDDAGKETGGNTGNLICHIKGNKNIPGILLMAHMDTVMPGLGKKPIVNGDIIKSDGRTVLGGDDASGIVSILEAVRILREDKTEHGDIFVVFTIAEEIGLIGAKHLNIDNINAAYAFVLDGEGSAGGAAVPTGSCRGGSPILQRLRGSTWMAERRRGAIDRGSARSTRGCNRRRSGPSRC